MKLFSVKWSKFRQTLMTAIACLAALSMPARAKDWKISSSVNYNTGKYGTADRTDSIYIPFTLKRYYRNADLSITVPYLRQSSTGQVILMGGKPVLVTRRKAAAAASAKTSTASGLGDIILRGAYTLLREESNSFDLALTGKLKLPTANKNKGLGTGELDQGAGLEFAKELTPSWTLLADGYYTIIGDTPGMDFNNQISLDMGFYKRLSTNLALTVLYETESALVAGNLAPGDVCGTLSYNTPDGLQFYGGLLVGISDGSPDTGISAGLSRKF